MTRIAQGKQVWLVAGLLLALLALSTIGIHNVTRENNLGIDQIIFWHAGRAVFLESASPYTEEVAQLSQLSVYKRLAAPNEDQLAFVYPPFTLLVLLPTYWMDYSWAQALWLAFNLLVFASVFPLFYPQHRRWVPLSALLLYPLTFGLITGNFAVLITSCLLILFALILQEQPLSVGSQVVIGMMLAWITFKPQFVWLILAFYLLASLRQRRIWLLVSFATGVMMLVLISFWMVPNWLTEWLARIDQYTQYNHSLPILTLFLQRILPQRIASLLTGATLALALAATAWLFRRWWQGKQSALSVTAWCGLVVYTFHPHGASYEQLTFMFPMLIWAATAQQSNRRFSGWLWVGMLVASWVIFAIAKSHQPPPLATEWLLFPAAAWVIWLVTRELKKPESLSGIMGQPSP
ncbi:MAG: DUF2029 domain-containing protein [Anaerolineae bacterium]|nr:DUF2029 domain-containing protein [Anaerolineae bacterium]